MMMAGQRRVLFSIYIAKGRRHVDKTKYKGEKEKRKNKEKQK
jgi:hypothetical protein